MPSNEPPKIVNATQQALDRLVAARAKVRRGSMHVVKPTDAEADDQPERDDE